MSAAAARSKTVRLALALAGVLIALGALAWWMSDALDTTADVAEASPVRTIEASALKLDPTSVDSADVVASSTRKAEAPAPVVDPAAKAPFEWGRLQVTLRSSSAHVSVITGKVVLDPSVLRNRKQVEAVEPMGFFNVQSASIDTNGRATFDKLPFGDWILRVNAEGFDRAEQNVTIENGAVMKLEITLDPLVLAELAVVLRHPNGIPLFDAVSGAELEVAETLRPVFLAECPKIGEPVPHMLRRLIQRSRFVREEHPDQWMHATFKQPVAGCACVLLGERVLDAVPFTAGQEVVVLRVDPAALAVTRCTLGVLVTDELSNAPIAGADVRVTRADGRMLPLTTDAEGRVRVEDLMPGDVRIQVQAAHHASGERRALLSAVHPTHLDIALAPRFWIRGGVRFPASGSVAYGISAYPTALGNRDATATAYRPTSAADTFELGPLAPGEYMVGLMLRGIGRPLAENVRRGEVDGWCIVDLRTRDVDGLTVVVTEALAARLRADLEFKR